MDTFERVVAFLEEQDDFIYKSKISKTLIINSQTVDLILSKLEKKLEWDEKKRVKLCSK